MIVGIGHELVFNQRGNNCHSDILWRLEPGNGIDMHIVVIGWLWVVLMMSVTERSITSGVMSFLFFGIAPCALLLWLFGGVGRRRRRAQAQPDQPLVAMTDDEVNAPNGQNAQADQGKLRE